MVPVAWDGHVPPGSLIPAPLEARPQRLSQDLQAKQTDRLGKHPPPRSRCQEEVPLWKVPDNYLGNRRIIQGRRVTLTRSPAVRLHPC